MELDVRTKMVIQIGKVRQSQGLAEPDQDREAMVLTSLCLGSGERLVDLYTGAVIAELVSLPVEKFEELKRQTDEARQAKLAERLKT